MYKNNKLAKNRSSTAVPAVAAPFVPASMPGSDMHWRKTAQRKSKGEKLSKSQTKSGSQPRLKNRTSEYDENFVEWELPEHMESPINRRNVPTSFYERDMNAFDWKSEQQRSFMPKDQQSRDGRTAGMSHTTNSNAPASFAWELEEPRIDSDNEVVAMPERGRVVTADHGHSSRRQASEHTSKFSWPVMGERVQSAKPAAVNKGSPLAFDTGALLNSAQQWHSEYDAQCAELRRKQQELLRTTQSVPAGVASHQHDEIPTFYAWEQDSESHSYPAAPRPPLSTGHLNTTSEYKTKYVEFPLQEREKPFIPAKPVDLNLFEEPIGASLSPERTASVLHQDYPGHDVLALSAVARTASPICNRLDTNPKSFAWPLVDGGAGPDADEEEHQALLRKHRVKNLVMPNSNCSEYTRTFATPPMESYMNRTKPQKAVPGKALDLFAENAGCEEAKKSEYDASFKQPVGAEVPVHVTASSQTAARMQNNPNQFAWSLVNGGEQTLDSPPRAKRPVLPDQDMSEYSRKFHWPPATDRTSPVRSTAAAATESIIGLDVDSQPSQWQSEYDLQCAQLRQKQQDLVASGSTGHIAGVPSKKHDKFPTNYAWEVTPSVAAPVTELPEPSEYTQNAHSEYADSFVKWPTVPRDIIKPKPLTETLNLFRTEACVETKSVDSADCTAVVHAPVKSEYADSFHAFDASAAAARTHSVGGQRGLPLPPQFAWPRVDPPSPPTEHVRATDGEPVFSETSEYNSKFAWPARIERPAPVRNTTAQATNTSIIVPIPDKTDTTSSESNEKRWVSEYDAHSADILLHSADTASVAGMATAVHGRIPHFYAWSEKDVVQRPPPVELPRYAGEQVKSEHDEKFVAWPVVSKVESPVRTMQKEPALNLLSFSNTEENGKTREPLSSEYHAKFIAHTAEELSQQVNPFTHQRSSAIEVPKPPQFAWPLVDGIPNKEAHIPVETATTPHTEYATQFVWNGFPETASSQSQLPISRSQSSTGPIPVDEEAVRTSDWRSEYDDRCATLRQKQEELLSSSEFTAGRHSVPPETAPSFFAYENNVEKPAVSISHTRSAEPELSEYAASFKTWPIKPEMESNHNRRGAESHYKETFKTFQFGKDRSFKGLTEYDDQYRPKTAPATAAGTTSAVPHQLAATMNAKYSAPNPIVPAPAPVVPHVDVPRPVSAPLSTATETRDNYNWPDKSKLSKTTAPLCNSLKSSLVFGTNHPAVRGKKATAPNKPLFISARAVGREAKRSAALRTTSSHKDEFPDSPFQSVTGLESTAGSEHSVSGSSDGKYRLMSQAIKDRRTGGGTRSDYTTGALSSTAQATVSRVAPGAGHFHESQRYGFGSTGSISADSLVAGAPSSRCAKAAESPIPTGLHFPEQRSHAMYRARSAPHGQRIAVSQHHGHCSPSKARVAMDDTASSNPVLMHKRYPYVSHKQLGRWSTETGDQFRWRHQK